jgi:hypothetical protein
MEVSHRILRVLVPKPLMFDENVEMKIRPLRNVKMIEISAPFNAKNTTTTSTDTDTINK